MSEIDQLRKLAHEAPMNVFHKDHDGHCWVELRSRAWADRSREYGAALLSSKSQAEKP